jgi:nucleoside triphosphatase
VTEVNPWSFWDDVREKRYPDGRREDLYLISLMFECRAGEESIQLNDEFEAYAWVQSEQLSAYDLNAATQVTFGQMGLL